jgi:beta-lactamase class A
MAMLRHLIPAWMVAGALAAAPPLPPRAQMDQRIRAAISRTSGTVFLYARNLDTGEAYGIREDERVRTASTIKLPIMVAVFAAVSQGRARWEETLPLAEADKVSGSGVIREFSSGLRWPIRDLVNVMIVVSDNTATNLLLDRFTADAVNAEMDKLGLKQTRVLRKIVGDPANLKPQAAGWSAAGRIPENQPYGIGVSTPREMVTLLEKIENGQVVSRAASRQMIEILKRQQYKNGIGRKLGEMPVASKSGALDRLRSDVGIVYAPAGRLALAVTVDHLPEVDYSPDNPGAILISELTQMLIGGLLQPAQRYSQD